MQNQVLRQCRICGLQAESEDDLALFQNSARMRHGKANLCKACDNESKRNKTGKDRENYLLQKRRNHFKSKYGMTLEDRDRLIADTACCEICGVGITQGDVQNAHIDHSHVKGHVRGVLCNKCNTGLGKFNDSIDMLNKAIKYLVTREHKLNGEDFGMEVILDMQYWDAVNGTTTWVDAVAAVKAQYPKPS